MYNEITKNNTYLTAKFNAMYSILDRYVKFLPKLEEYKIPLPNLPFSMVSEAPSFNVLNYDNNCPQELVEEYDTLVKECNYNRIGRVFCGDNTMFLFNFLSKEDELTAMVEGKKELKKFLNLYATYNEIPSYFKFSKTAGQQDYSYKAFKRVYDAIGKRLTKDSKRGESDY